MRSTSKSTAPQRKHATSNLAPPSSTHPGYAAAGRDGRPRAALLAAADDRRLAPPVEAIVPVAPTEHQRPHYFGRRHHHLVPGTVTINGTAYICDLDGKRFVDRDVFVAHLRTAHHTAPARIPDLLLVRDGRVHFVGE